MPPAYRPLVRPMLILALAGIIAGAVVFYSRGEGADRDEPPAAAAGPGAAIGFVEGSASVGQPAPDFALETLDGDVVRLSDFRGQTVIINFWATWCLPCYLEMPAFQALYDERTESGDLAVLAVNITPQDSRAGAASFVDELGLTFPVLLETEDLAVAQAYGLERLPGTFFIDREGILRDVSYGLMVDEALTDRVAATDAAPGE